MGEPREIPRESKAMTKTVWAIEEGEYSDYHVVGVFSSRENAEIVQAKAGGEIVEWPLNPAVDAIRQGLRQWQVVMLRNGTVEKAWQLESFSSYRLNEPEGQDAIWRRTQAPAFKGKGIPDAINVTVWGKSEQQAVKRANEIRTQLIAMGEW